MPGQAKCRFKATGMQGVPRSTALTLHLLAAIAMARIRQLIGVNLILGLPVSGLAVIGKYSGF
jgi:hypothetical protein